MDPSLSNGGRIAIGYLRDDNMVGSSHGPFPSERGDPCLPDAASPLGKARAAPVGRCTTLAVATF